MGVAEVEVGDAGAAVVVGTALVVGLGVDAATGDVAGVVDVRLLSQVRSNLGQSPPPTNCRLFTRRMLR